MRIFSREQMLEFRDIDPLITKIEKGFSAYSQGLVNMPPVCHMHFEKPLGDLHIKCAAKLQEQFYIVKIASYFPKNTQTKQTSIKGVMLLFNQQSGEPVALFLDEGYLTHLRTAIAGAICAKYLAPKNVKAIGIIGSGVQAKFQLHLLSYVTNCREVWIWSRNDEEMKLYQNSKELKDFKINIAKSAQEVAKNSRLIVTTTPSLHPLLFAQDIHTGTHITAIGSDRPGKQELDPSILELANRVIVDSRLQCFSYGETFCAIQSERLLKSKVDEIGEIILGTKPGRINDEEITVADLTGLGIQDLEIGVAFYQFLSKKHPET